MSQLIRIAVSGGGLAGVSLLQALLKSSHLDIHIFESAAAFKESGMAIGIARNALAALELIGPSATECLKRAGAVPMKGVRFMLAQGESQGSLIDEVDGEQLLAGVPEERMHAAKKKKLDETKRNDDGSLILHFTDGTTHECDILIGADGIHSTDDPAASPRNTGTWLVMTLQPFSIEDAREYSWIRDGSFILHNLLSDGQLVQFVIASYDKEAESTDRWNRSVNAEEIKSLYKDWPPHLSKAVDELLCDQPEHQGMYLWEHPPAHTYVSGPICVMGDAAHATTPWQGSGGGMSIEDSLVLSTLLGCAKTPSEAVTALKVYDQVRRPRTHRIVESSHGTGMIMRGRGKDIGLDLGKLREKLLPRRDFIVDYDNEKHLKKAVEIMKGELKG
ncbi:FAD/NAD(P)-binding domain-containing protein [Daldinia loculata]|uniref:FAD/NAD(P)-binding domain-containing protein n=1 Tax=Daldinia loculata TaxID=103429 RepID=UPI0020C31FAB|nr:FAD/NAD(P)-binding domain-containing protein [Daldinia loculata]KAI1651940.1 FAD/NAD(P)-binding domain-containing protein [Daldinia loculata]